MYRSMDEHTEDISSNQYTMATKIIVLAHQHTKSHNVHAHLFYIFIAVAVTTRIYKCTPYALVQDSTPLLVPVVIVH